MSKITGAREKKGMSNQRNHLTKLSVKWFC